MRETRKDSAVKDVNLPTRLLSTPTTRRRRAQGTVPHAAGHQGHGERPPAGSRHGVLSILREGLLACELYSERMSYLEETALSSWTVDAISHSMSEDSESPRISGIPEKS